MRWEELLSDDPRTAHERSSFERGRLTLEEVEPYHGHRSLVHMGYPVWLTMDQMEDLLDLIEDVFPSYLGEVADKLRSRLGREDT
jgi:hypothetical protein